MTSSSVRAGHLCGPAPVVKRGDRVDQADGVRAAILRGGFQARACESAACPDREKRSRGRSSWTGFVEKKSPGPRHSASSSARSRSAGPKFSTRPTVGRGVAVRGVDAPGQIRVPRFPHGAAQLLEVVLVRERRVLVEPLRRQQLGGAALGLPAVLETNPDANEGLGRLGERDHAEAKGHAQPHVALEERDSP